MSGPVSRAAGAPGCRSVGDLPRPAAPDQSTASRMAGWSVTNRIRTLAAVGLGRALACWFLLLEAHT